MKWRAKRAVAKTGLSRAHVFVLQRGKASGAQNPIGGRECVAGVASFAAP